MDIFICGLACEVWGPLDAWLSMGGRGQMESSPYERKGASLEN